MERKYDFIIVGSGLFGATFAYRARRAGMNCLVIDKRPQLGGNIYCENVNGINVHKYGAHIFHTDKKDLWDFVNSFVEFNSFINSPLAFFKGELYNLPFNMNTFHQMWRVTTPTEAKNIIDGQKADILEQIRIEGATGPRNLEEQALLMVGKDVYEKLIKEYTEKQWGRRATELPAFIIKRIPLRFTFDNNYFNDRFQGIPKGGYNKLIEGLLDGIETKVNTDFFDNREYWGAIASKIVFTGKLDEFYDYRFGKLEYRTLRFEEYILNHSNYQGNAVVNYTDKDTPFTRIIEHKHFELFGQDVDTIPSTVISKEFPAEWVEGMEPYYPISDDKNTALYAKYKALADQENYTYFGGRLAEYKYYDMGQTIQQSMILANKLFG